MNGFYCLKRLRGNEPIAFDAIRNSSTLGETSRTVEMKLTAAPRS